MRHRLQEAFVHDLHVEPTDQTPFRQDGYNVKYPDNAMMESLIVAELLQVGTVSTY